jgi:DNA-binding response OmpR family regulator
MAKPLTVIKHRESAQQEIEAPDLRALVIGQHAQSDEFLIRRLQHWMRVDMAPNPVIPYALTFGDVYDVIIVHRPLDGLNGSVAMCHALRRGGVNAPIILMVPYGSTNDLVAALEAGADDFMIEPVNFKLLAARIRAFQRRTPVSVTPAEAIGYHMLRGPPEL